MSRKISNWGRFPVVTGDLYCISDTDQLGKLVRDCESLIARGKGRCYGDSSLNARMLSMPSYDKITAFDEKTGELTCQAGTTLEEILDIFVPRSWFLPVTPGTKFITVGGAIAADVHGKNHHLQGSFCQHISSMEIMLANGEVTRCSPNENKQLFETTCGGMGLTGVILSATFKLRPIASAYIREETILARNLDEIMALFDESGEWTYSVAWIDCLAKGMDLGRSVMMRGEHASVGELGSRQAANPFAIKKGLSLKVPFDLPSCTLNNLSVSLFNFLIYHKYKNATFISDYDSFFYPLDSISHWNRIYGRKGFTQYQCVLPKSVSYKGMQKILTRIGESGMGSFLAVLKLFGTQDNFISFPMEGYTLALDFPVNKRLFPLLDELDEIVLSLGGRLYLAKDARMAASMFKNSYPNAKAFIQRIAEYDSKNKFRSLQSDRLEITT